MLNNLIKLYYELFNSRYDFMLKSDDDIKIDDIKIDDIKINDQRSWIIIKTPSNAQSTLRRHQTHKKQ